MVRSAFLTLRRTLVRGGQSGQAIIILALGFIALIAFVGIVVDVSLMFVRYSTLSRSVDSAAIAAAGQMRSDRSYADVSLAARQMIELHGLDPIEVKVETCQTAELIQNPEDPGGDLIVDKSICPDEQRKLVRVSSKIMSPTVFMRLLGFTDIELSAVSISETAVLDVVVILDTSESMLHDTTYEDWANIGFGKVYVPPVWDPESGFDRGPFTGSNQPRGVFQKMIAPSPNRFTTMNPEKGGDDFDDLFQFWDEHLRATPQEISERLVYSDSSPVHRATWGAYYEVKDFDYPGTTNQKHPREECRVRFWPYSSSIKIPDHIRTIPQFAGQFEGSTTAGSTWGGWAPAFDFYGCCNDPTANGGFDRETGLWGPLPGYTVIQPTNSPHVGDWDFSDLICQPFKQARDATAAFIDRVDFARGDRMAFVTFAQGATIIDPDGEFGCDTKADEDCVFRDEDKNAVEPIGGNDRSALTHMIESRERALDTLYRHIGVRTEAYFYKWNENGGGWTDFALGIKDGVSNVKNFYTKDLNLDADNNGDKDILLNDYPVRDNCPFFNAALPGLQSLYSLWNWDWRGNKASTYDNFAKFGSTNPGLNRIMTPDTTSGPWAGVTDIDHQQSYEKWASCGYTNFGAALREANNALLDPQTTRRTGTVWVIIFLGDGATATSDMVRLNGRKPQRPEPYTLLQTPARWPMNDTTNPAGPNMNVVNYGIRGEYGVFGLCPLGTPSQRSQLTRTNRPEVVFPFCSDEEPHTRHFCQPPNKNPANVGKSCPGGGGAYTYGFAPGAFDEDYDCNAPVEENLGNGNIYDVDVGSYYAEDETTCDIFYDVDDYARDWADYIGLARPGAGDQQLPTIFTIGFGLDFVEGSIGDPADPNYQPGVAARNISDWLGEELLRYIADVGDNNRIDTDYQQDLREDKVLDGVMFTSSERFGLRGPCEDPNVLPNDGERYIGQLVGNGYSTSDAERIGPDAVAGLGIMVRPLPPRQDCGNYYNAPDQARLTIVFNDIASRMFTRLAP